MQPLPRCGRRTSHISEVLGLIVKVTISQGIFFVGCKREKHRKVNTPVIWFLVIMSQAFLKMSSLMLLPKAISFLTNGRRSKPLNFFKLKTQLKRLFPLFKLAISFSSFLFYFFTKSLFKKPFIKSFLFTF